MYKTELHKGDGTDDLLTGLTSLRARITAKKLKEMELTDTQRTELYNELFGNVYKSVK